jgi:hypothetical protein
VWRLARLSCALGGGAVATICLYLIIAACLHSSVGLAARGGGVVVWLLLLSCIDVPLWELQRNRSVGAVIAIDCSYLVV